jgi:hypothetical protein
MIEFQMLKLQFDNELQKLCEHELWNYVLYYANSDLICIVYDR